jgi:hypothetical protein
LLAACRRQPRRRPRLAIFVVTYRNLREGLALGSIRLLKNAGLVVEEARGTRRIYRLHSQGVEAVQRYLAQVWGEAAARFRLLAENTR